MKKVIVFGGAGFLGKSVVKELIAKEFEVTVFDIVKDDELNVANYIEGSILDEELVTNSISGHDVVYNFAGIADIKDASERPVDTVKLNILGNVNILEACKKANVKRYVYASTAYAYSRTGSFYRCSKQACESYIEEYSKQYDLDFTILRYGSLYGSQASGRNAIKTFVESAIEDKRIKYSGNPESVREYIHVDDASKSSVEILNNEFRNQHVLLTGTQQMKIKDVLEMIKEILPFDIEIEFSDEKSYASSHYRVTPYSFSPKKGLKYTRPVFVDIGQGILSLIEEAYSE